MSSSTAAQELEMIVGEECRGHGGESHECWEEVCMAVLKQGELQSGKVMADLCESYGEFCSDMCVHEHPYYTCIYIISLYDNTCDILLFQLHR